MNKRREAIEQRLLTRLAPLECEVDDESALHIGHSGAGSGGHYRVRLVCSAFEEKSRLMRHRLVYDCLKDMVPHDIHALTIVAVAPSEC